MSNQQQVDNLVELLDGYSQKGGHHLNVKRVHSRNIVRRSKAS